MTWVRSAPLGVPLVVTITGTYGSGQTATANISLTVVAAQALPAEAGALTAAAAGRTDIAATLSGLGSAITALVAVAARLVRCRESRTTRRTF